MKILHQFYNANDLLTGNYFGKVHIMQVLEKGSFGIGTINGLDGELMIFDHEPWVFRGDGKLYPLDKLTQTPFVAVTKFEAEQFISIKGVFDFKSVNERIETEIGIDQNVYAIMVKGMFKAIRVRTSYPVNNKYISFAEVVKNTIEYTYRNISGVLMGFYIPKRFAGINIPGYHYHFIDNKKTVGGHVEDFYVQNPEIEIMKVDHIELIEK